METMLRWRAGLGATTAERKQFLVCCLLVQKPTNSVAEAAAAAAMQGLGPGNKSEGVAAEERRGVAATGSACHCSRTGDTWPLAGAS